MVPEEVPLELLFWWLLPALYPGENTCHSFYLAGYFMPDGVMQGSSAGKMR